VSQACGIFGVASGKAAVANTAELAAAGRFGPCPTAPRGTSVSSVALGGGGVPIPGGVQKTCRCGTSGRLAGVVVLGGWLDLVILEVFSNL